jgi:hypothetical protein
LQYVVCDEKVVLYEDKVFQMLVQRQYMMVVPHKGLKARLYAAHYSDISTVMADLSNKSKRDQNTPDTAIAREALERIKNAHSTAQLKILNAKGEDVTKEHFDNVRPEDPPSCSGQSSDDDNDEPQILLGITRRATDLSLESRNKPGMAPSAAKETARPAILLTEDKSTRTAVARGGQPALSPSVLKKFLERGVNRLRSLSQSSQNRTPISTTPPPVLSPTGIKALDGSSADQIMEETGR